MENQYNHTTQQEYQGGNQQELMNAKVANKFTADAWLTFLQARQCNLKIKKGSHGVAIFKGLKEYTEKDEAGKVTTKQKPLGFARVFNLDQTEPMKVNA